jgi:hypothetical protein
MRIIFLLIAPSVIKLFLQAYNMKFNCGPSPLVKEQLRKVRLEKKAEGLMRWHHWFAWYPVRIDENHCRWLEIVERKMNNAYVGMHVEIRIFGGTKYRIKS